MGILAGRAKNEFSYLLGKSTAQMKRRHEMLAELQTYPQAITDYEEGVQQVLVNDEWFDFLLAKWNKFGDLATDEIAGIDAMLQLIADERRLMVPKQLAEAFPAQRHQCIQALGITAATTSNMEAARAGMTLEAFLDWRAANRP